MTAGAETERLSRGTQEREQPQHAYQDGKEGTFMDRNRMQGALPCFTPGSRPYVGRPS